MRGSKVPAAAPAIAPPVVTQPIRDLPIVRPQPEAARVIAAPASGTAPPAAPSVRAAPETAETSAAKAKSAAVEPKHPAASAKQHDRNGKAATAKKSPPAKPHASVKPRKRKPAAPSPVATAVERPEQNPAVTGPPALPICQPGVFNRPAQRCRPSHERIVRKPFFGST